MMWLTDLAAAARTSGLRVVEVQGWQDRGVGPMASVSSIIAHHTATGSDASGDYPTLRVVRDGRAGLGGPLSQLGLGRSGTVYVIAAGLCYHAGVVHQPWQANAHAVGIEAEHPGAGTPWPRVQYDAYVRLCSALAAHYRVPVSRVLGHKEVAKPVGRKSDPSFDMTIFRAALSLEDDMTPEQYRTAFVELMREAATRSTPTGRQLGDYLAATVAPSVAALVWSAQFGAGGTRQSAAQRLAIAAAPERVDLDPAVLASLIEQAAGRVRINVTTTTEEP